MRNFIYFLLICTLGCKSNGLDSPALSTDMDVWDIRLNHQAILMSTIAPYDTVRLDIIGRNAKGIPIVHDGTVTFFTRSRNVYVDSSGVVRALQAIDEAWVIAEFVEGNIRYTDSARIRVVDTLSSSIAERLEIESAVTSHPAAVPFFFDIVLPFDTQVSSRVFLSDGTILLNPYVRYWSSNPTIATVGSYDGVFRGLMPGKSVYVYAGATVFGHTVLDSVQINITNPTFVKVGTGACRSCAGSIREKRFSPSLIEIGVGGSVWFQSPADSSTYDIIFEDSLDLAVFSTGDPLLDMLFQEGLPELFGTGNVHTTDSLSGAIRRFMRPGRYRYKSITLNSEGEILVR